LYVQGNFEIYHVIFRSAPVSPTHGLRLPPPSSTPPSQPHESSSPTKLIPPPHSTGDTMPSSLPGQINTPAVSSSFTKQNIPSAV